MLAWVDVETTGLDPREGALLEVGIMLTDDNLVAGDSISVTIIPPPNVRAVMRPEVLEMHDAGIGNGLLADCEDLGQDREQAMLFLCSWLNKRVEEPPVMAGSTVGFDRRWLQAKMPLLEQQFHYRSVDVSSLKELNRRWGFAPEWEGDRDIHRAIPDLEDSIAELKWYRDHLLVGQLP